MIRIAITFVLIVAAVPVLAHGAGFHTSLQLPFLALGFAVGLAHALDADHVAAVAAMMGRGDSRGRVIARGAVWGLGHTASLFVICTAAVLVGFTISTRASAIMELAVGLMIAALGLKVFWTLWRERIHIHVHEHDGHRHVHAHSHKGDADEHVDSTHDHTHAARALLPTLGVGLLHGAAGSAGLLILIVASATSISQAILAFALFGIGSMVGMTLLTAAASYPLARLHRGSAFARSALAISIGCLALAVGTAVSLSSIQTLQSLALF